MDALEVSDDDMDDLETLVDALLDEEIVSTLVHNLHRLDDSANPLTATATAEAQATHNTLGEGHSRLEVKCVTRCYIYTCLEENRGTDTGGDKFCDAEVAVVTVSI